MDFSQHFPNSSPKLLALKSSNIFLDDCFDPISGMILINSEQFEEIIPDSALNPECWEKILTHYEFYDFGQSFIFPGIIDLNVHMNSHYEDKWNSAAEVTQMAAQGGITTIVDSPLMSFYDSDFNEQECISNRIKELEGKINVDCGILAYLGDHNYMNVKEIYDKNEILGFKLYLSRTMIPDLPIIERKCLKSLFKKIDKDPILQKVLFVFDCVYVSDRERFQCSPMRSEKKEIRFDLSYEIINKTAGGVHEGIEVSESQSDIAYTSDQEDDFFLDEVDHDTNNILGEDEIEINKLRKKSSLVAKSQKEYAIADVELKQYHEKFSINKFDDEKESEKAKLNSSLSTDNELFNKINELSEDDVENSTTTSRKIYEPSPKIRELKHESPPKVFVLKDEAVNSEKVPFLGNPLKDSIREIYIKMSENEKKTEVITLEEANSDECEKNQEQETIIHDITAKNETPEEEKATEEINKKKIVLPQNKLLDSLFKPMVGPSKLLARRITVPNMNIADKRNLQKKIFTELKDIQTDKEDDKMKVDLNNRDYNNYLANHSLSWETNGIRQIFRCLKGFSNVTLLFSNLSSMSLFFMVKFLGSYKPLENIHLYTEVCIPYLYFHNKMIKPSQTKYKNTPPIRIKEERDLMIQGLKINNLIDVVSSFHMSNPSEYKRIDKGNFRRCFDGLSCIGFNLQVIWTKLYIREKKKWTRNNKNRKENIERKKLDVIFKEIIKKICVNPAKIIGVDNRKGSIKKGLHADLVVWDPFKIITIEQKNIALASPKLFLFNQRKLYGEVTHTFLRGKLIYKIGGDLNVKSGKIMKRS